MKPFWIIEVATNVLSRELQWQPLVTPGLQTQFEEGRRKEADQTTIRLANMFHDQLMFRVRCLKPKRGGFQPRPRPARILGES